MNNQIANGLKNKENIMKKKKANGLNNRESFGYLFIAPFLIVFIIFSIYPVFRTLYLSLTDYSGFNIPTFVRFENYARVFNDKIFWEAFVNTLKIWGVNIVLQLGLAFTLTLIFSDMKYKIRGLSIFRALFYLPNLIAATSVAFLFKNLLDWRFGSLNQILVEGGITERSIDWLGTPITAQVAVGVIGAWVWFGNSFIILMAGVQGINKDYYEAAAIDGAGRFKTFGKITLPLLRPIMLYVAITSLIGGLQMFDIPYLITNGNGAPRRALNTAVMYLMNMAFENRQIGYAGAIAFVLFLITALCSIGVYFLMYHKKEEN